MKRKFLRRILVFLLALSMTLAGNTAFTSASLNSTSHVSAQMSLRHAVNPYKSHRFKLTKKLLKFHGRPYRTVHGNEPYFTKKEITKKDYEYYGGLDSLGRCSYAAACIDTHVMPTEPRGEIGMVKPTGWHTIKYDVIPDRYLYNRCHLIAYELSGENANEENLITGTRYLNIEGMLPFENKTAEYVKNTGNHVLYRVTPVFKDNEFVARGVLMEGYSVEDKGAGLCFCVYCYNNQPGIYINYKDGTSHEKASGKSGSSGSGSGSKNSSGSGGSSGSSGSDNRNSSGSGSGSSGSGSSGSGGGSHASGGSSGNWGSLYVKTGTTYIINLDSKKFHLPSCRFADEISKGNKKVIRSTAKKLKSAGFSACKVCID